MAGISDLTALVPPPAVPFEAADAAGWSAIETTLGIVLPQDLFDLATTYGTGWFRSSDGNSYRIENPCSKWFPRHVKTWQAVYAEHKVNGVHKPWPGELYPADPGLLNIGSGERHIALFLSIRDRKADGTVVALTLQEQWLQASCGLIAFLVGVLKGEIDLWGTPESHSGIVWTFEATVPDPPDLLPPLMEAVLLGDLNRVRSLVQAGADPNLGGQDGATPLCSIDDEAMVRLLLELGANPNLPDARGRTPLSCACSSHLPSGGLRALLEAGADPNQTDACFGATPLIVACSFKELEVVELLLQFGANPNAVSADGMTALRRARKRPEILAALWAAGAQ